jgi:predicted metalloprotease with PDZ domain
MRTLLLGFVVASLSSSSAAASKPAGAALAPIRIAVDARDIARKVLHAHLTIAATPGPLTLLYPKWIPGEHGPSGPIVNLTGMTVRAAGGASVAWTRDPVDMFSFHVDVPAGASRLDVDLDFLLPMGGDFTAGRSASDRLGVLAWNTVLLYPQGLTSDSTVYEAALSVPEGWSWATALPEKTHSAKEVTFNPVSLTRLVDSPVLMGANLRPVRLGNGEPLHEVEFAADSPLALDLKPEWKTGLDHLVEQAFALFKARHYTSYRWLVSLSDHVAHFGLEHHESSDDRLGERTLADDAGRRSLAFLLAHEYVHSWNGKFRRPADLLTSDYGQPMQSGLLWVYEGLTEYLGFLLPARSGLWTAEEYRECLASIAATLDRRAGRSWRSLGDTATAAQVLYGAPQEGESWRRSVDFYDESALIWLEAEVLIRRATQGQRSLDDFCRKFHGGPEGPYVVKPYTLDEVVTTLGGVAPHDWRGFFDARVTRLAPRATLAGIEGSGWKLTFSEQPNVFRKDAEAREKETDESTSIGIVVREDGRLRDVNPTLAAGQAGIAAGMKLVAVNTRRYTPEVLRDALRATRSGTPIELLIENDDFLWTRQLKYDGGLRYPHLVRDESQPDVLTQIIASR